MAAVSINVGDDYASFNAAHGAAQTRCLSAYSDDEAVAEASVDAAGAARVLALSPGACEVFYEFSDGTLNQDTVTVTQPAPGQLEIDASPSRETVLAQWITPPASDSVIGFRARIRQSAIAAWEQTVFLDPWTTAHLFSGLDPGVEQVVEVSAINSDGEGNLQYGTAGTETLSTLAFPAPPLPPLATGAQATGGFAINWQPGTDSQPATGWEPQFKSSETRQWTDLGLREATARTQTVPAPLGGTFDWRVRGISPYGIGGWTTGQITLPSLLPGQVRNVRLTLPNIRGAPTIAWERPSTGAAVGKYVIQCGDNALLGDGRRAVFEVPASVTSVQLPGAYRTNSQNNVGFRVRAENAAGPGPWSQGGPQNQVFVPQEAANISSSIRPNLTLQAQYARPTEITVATRGASDNIFQSGQGGVGTAGVDGYRGQGAIFIDRFAANFNIRLEMRPHSPNAWGNYNESAGDSYVDIFDHWFERVAHVFANLSPNTQYQFRASFWRFDRNGTARNGRYGNVLTVRTPPTVRTAPPIAPVTNSYPGGDVVFEADGPMLVWKLNGGQSVDRWILRWRAQGATAWNTETLDPDVFHLQLRDRPQPGGMIEWQVRGDNNAASGTPAGQGAWSALARIGEAMGRSSPASMSAAVIGARAAVRFTWENSPYEPGRLYDRISVYRANGGANAEPDVIVPLAQQQQQTHTERRTWAAGAVYWYAAEIETGVDSLGQFRFFRTPSGNVPGQPTIRRSRNTFTATFAAADAVTRWQLDISTARDFTSFAESASLVPDPPGNVFTATRLTTGTTYHWRARAQNSLGWGAYRTGSFTAA